LNPNEYGAMGILAVDALVREDLAGALAYWRRQLSSATPGSAAAQELRERIALIADYLDEQDAAPVSGATISVTIDIAPELASRVSDDMRLFVYVRNPAQRAPLVAQNLAVP